MFHGRFASGFHFILGTLFWINGYKLPSAHTSPKMVSIHDDMKLQCKFPNNSFPRGNVKWYKNDKLLENTIDKHIIRKNGRVVKFKRIVEGDAGIYLCRDMARNAVIILYNISVQQLPLQRKLKFKSLDTIMKQQNSVKPVGYDITFDCTAVGIRPIRYKWFKGGETLVSNQPKLKLKGLVRSDSSNYTCVAENKYGNIALNVVLFVQERVWANPYIEKFTMKNQTRYVGDNVSIVCYELITGTVPDFRWLKWTGVFNETLLRKYLSYLGLESGVGSVDVHLIPEEFYYPKVTQRAHRVAHGVEYMLTNVTKEDSGFYTCIASNLIGTDYASMYLDVKEKKKNNGKQTTKTINKINRENRNKFEIIACIFGILAFISAVSILWLLVRWKCASNSHHDAKLSKLDEGYNLKEKQMQSKESTQSLILSVGSDEVNAEYKGSHVM